MASQYKLTYFPVRGLGEQIITLLKDNKLDFTNDAFDSSKWAEIKKTMTFGQVPAFYDGDYELVQSGAILRYLARKHDLYGKDIKEQAFIDMFYEAVVDLRSKYVRMIYGNYEDGKLDHINNTAPTDLGYIAKILEKHNGKKAGFINGDKICFADYTFYEVLCAHVTLSPPCLEPFPALQAYYKLMSDRPNMQTYLASDERKNKPFNGNSKQ